ncbi:hypothetical protein ACFQYP_14545 [Nonomuraea antimicrobica]
MRRYDVTGLVRPGANTVRVESDGWVLVDGLAVSGPDWTRGDGADRLPARVRRRQHGDPAALWLLPRPHPLPGADWLDGGPTALPTVFAVPGAHPRVERFLLDAPPGATGIEVHASGRLEVHAELGGHRPRDAEARTGAQEADGRTGTGEVEIRVHTRPGAQGARPSPAPSGSPAVPDGCGWATGRTAAWPGTAAACATAPRSPPAPARPCSTWAGSGERPR